MKRVILVFTVLFVALAVSAQAGNYEDPCQSPYFSKVINECGVDANDMREDRRFEVGMGVDVTLYEDKGEGAIVEKVTEEYRYDWANGEHSAYTVVHVNLFQKIKGLLSKGE